jgi:hypothetical protein
MLCAIHQTPPVRMACNGDSGGPLTYNNHIVGIVSFGIENCMSNAPNAYTRVSKYSGMIYGLMQKFLAPNQQSLTFPFTNVDDGSTSSQTVTMKSEGDNPVIVQSITADGDFFVANNACNGTIAPGTSCDVTVAFDPTANGTRTGSLHVVTDSPGLNDFPVALTGTGVGHLGPKAKLRVSLRGKTKKQHGRLRAAFNVSFPLPKGSTPKACIGAIRISVKTPHVKKPTARSGAIIWTGKSCRGTVIMRLPKKAKGKKVKIKESFAGNVEIAPSSVTHTVKIK